MNLTGRGEQPTFGIAGLVPMRNALRILIDSPGWRMLWAQDLNMSVSCLALSYGQSFSLSINP